jgi:WD40 repeat protein/transcriptional regulator with XRE-family HTH domain
MKRFSYSERDYAFGQIMLTLRTNIGLTQAGLGERLRVSRRAVARWEAGSSYPTAERLKQLITLGVQQQAFPAGRQEEEIRALWHAAHQKLLLDEAWLAALLGGPHPALTLLPPVPLAEPQRGEVSAAEPKPAPRVDWGEALDVPTFYDREQELATLSRWVVEEGCRLVSVLGMGGIGKSALAVRAMQQLAGHFEVVLFRSLRAAPDCSALLDDCLSVLSPEPLGVVPQSLERRLSLLLLELRSRRVLLVLDNLEVLLEEGDVLGRLRPGFEAYEHLLRQVAQTAHQSCLLLTSREKPAGLRALEGSRTPVRSLPLSGLDAAACAQLLAPLLARLQSVYQGRAEVEGQLRAGLDALRERAEETQGYGPANLVALLRLLRGDLRGLDLSRLALRGVYLQGVEMQDARLSGAVLQDSVFTEPFDAIMAVTMSRTGQYWAVGGRRGEVRVWREEGKILHLAWQAHTDTVPALSFSPDGRTLASGSFDHAIRLWDGQEGRSRVVLQGHSAVVNGLAFTPDSRSLLSGSEDGTLRVWDMESGQCIRIVQGYAVTLYDVAWSPDGKSIAGVGSDTLVTIWDGARRTPTLLHGHSWTVYGVAWGPDGRWLASGGWDHAVRLWDTTTGEARQILQDPDHIDTIFCGVAWSPDGQWLASASYQRGVQVWEVTTGTRRWVGWTDPPAWIRRVAWSPDGTRLASGAGGRDSGEIFVWEVQSGERLYTLNEPSAMINALAWSPTGAVLVSGGSDGRLRWWDMQSGECVRVQEAHQGTVQALKVSPDGSTLASCGEDGAIRLWDLESGEHLQTLRRDRPYERLDIRGIRGLSDAQKASLRALGAFENMSVGRELPALPGERGMTT